MSEFILTTVIAPGISAVFFLVLFLILGEKNTVKGRILQSLDGVAKSILAPFVGALIIFISGFIPIVCILSLLDLILFRSIFDDVGLLNSFLLFILFLSILLLWFKFIFPKLK